jgi:hypothetical protein
VRQDKSKSILSASGCQGWDSLARFFLGVGLALSPETTSSES